jgi:hypothetical protein
MYRRSSKILLCHVVTKSSGNNLGTCSQHRGMRRHDLQLGCANHWSVIHDELCTRMTPHIRIDGLHKTSLTEKCDATRRDAGRPATAPSAAEATGIVCRHCATDSNRGGA